MLYIRINYPRTTEITGLMAKSRTFQHSSSGDTEQEHQRPPDEAARAASGKENESNGDKRDPDGETEA